MIEACWDLRSSGHGPLALLLDRPARDRVAVDEEPAHDPQVHRDQIFAAALRGECVTRQPQAIIDAEYRNQRRRHYQYLIPVHPGLPDRNHMETAFRRS